MKKIKLILLTILVLACSACVNNKTIENSNIRVSIYPIEYITNYLFGEHSKINSIYPDSMDNNYEISDKLLKDYSSTNLFIFNGNEDKENDYVFKMLKNNSDLKIIDATTSLAYNNKIEELWLDPMNYLTMANNIKKGFNEYTDITYLNNDINSKYNELKVKLIELEADYNEMGNRANKKNLVVADDLFLYLSKYGINVISLEKGDNYSKKSEYQAEELIKNKEITNIYVKKGQKIDSNIEELKEKYKVNIIELNTLYTISEEDRKNGKDYLSLMNENLQMLKQQLYN